MLGEYFIEYWNSNVSKTVYADYNKLNVAEIIKYVNDKGEVTHITQREFAYW
jgi:hypothetical protein